MYVGVDHSTTGVKVGLLDEDGGREAFTLDRAALGAGEVTLLDALAERVRLSDIEQAAINYNWGNAISAIRPTAEAPNRGVKDQIGSGYETGGGTLAYDQLADSAVPAVVVPGVHRDLPPLHPYFSHYSALAGGDKVAAIRHASESVEAETFLWACVSSSCMAGLVVEGELVGFFHWIGLVHGWADPEAIRGMNDERAREVFTQCGWLGRSDRSVASVETTPDRELLERCYWSTIHNLYSLVPFAHELGDGPEAVALTGRLTRLQEPFDLAARVAEAVESVAPVHGCEAYSSAHGTATIARDVATGADDVLGIPVGGEAA